MRLTIGKKISITVATMIALVAISGLIANLSLISIQGSVGEMVAKSSPLIMATQEMIACNTQASFELHNYLTESNPEKLAEIENRYKKLIAEHDLHEQKICDAIDGLPCENEPLMGVWKHGNEIVMPKYGNAARQAILTHKDLLANCDELAICMDKHKEYGIKLLELLAGMQGKYSDVAEYDQALINLKTYLAMTIISEESYISKVSTVTPEDRLKFSKEFARQEGSFFEEFRSLKKAAIQRDNSEGVEAIFLAHSNFVNSAIGEKKLFDLCEREFALLEKQKNFIVAVDKLEIADYAMATKLLELASINLSKSGSQAYKKAGYISNGLVVFFVFALVISVAVMMNLSKRIVRPVLALSDASSRIAIGDLDQKIDVTGNDEVDELCRSFNKMSENLQTEVSIRKKAEKERERLFEILEGKNRELQNVVYIASHDLRSPLVTINGFSEELSILCAEMENILESENIDEEVKNKIIPLLKEGIPEDLRFIMAGAEKMQMLVDGLLQISRAGTAVVEMQALDMNDLLRCICDAMQYDFSNKDISITLRALPACFGDHNMINQVFSNLLDNAVKYRQSNGDDKIVVSGWLESGNSVYCVEDNGIGISAADQSKIFEVFHRLDPHGPVIGEGLGLTIINRILDRHDGEIWVESEPGEGSKFFVSIPSGI